FLTVKFLIVNHLSAPSATLAFSGLSMRPGRRSKVLSCGNDSQNWFGELRSDAGPKIDWLKRFEAPDEPRGPDFLGGERRPPDGKNLRALVDPLEAFFGFGDGFNGRDPESFG